MMSLSSSQAGIVEHLNNIAEAAILSVMRNRLNVKIRKTELSRMKSYRICRVPRKIKNIFISDVFELFFN